ncbi:MAG: hypothetical protein V2A56_06465 [bacterium]
MRGLMIEAAMINPSGKIELLNQQVSQELLNREWIQIRNSTGTIVTLDGIELMHLVYGPGEQTRESLVLRLQGLLPPQASLRIHSGKGTTSFDAEHQVYHGYANTKSSHFLFQVVKPDRLVLRKGRTIIDAARYDIPVPISRRLKRVLPLERQLLQAV